MIRTGGVLLGASAAAIFGSLYALRERDSKTSELAYLEVLNATWQAMGLPTSDLSDLRGEIRFYRGLSVGLATAAGALLLAGGGIALVGVNRRHQARRLTLRPGGLAWEVKF